MGFDLLIGKARAGCASSRDLVLAQASAYVAVSSRQALVGRVRSKVDALDLSQEVMLDLHRQLDKFGGKTEAEFLSWIKCVVTGHVARIHRSYLGTQIRNVKREQHGVDLGLFTTPADSVVDRAIHTEELVILESALSQLPETYRAVVNLRLDNLSFGEIALELDRSVDSVQKSWARGLVKLRNMIGHDLTSE